MPCGKTSSLSGAYRHSLPARVKRSLSAVRVWRVATPWACACDTSAIRHGQRVFDAYFQFILRARDGVFDVSPVAERVHG